MSTPAQTMFPPKPKRIITPLTPKHEADAIRQASAPKPKPQPEPDNVTPLEELEALASELSNELTKRPRTRK